MSWVVPLHLTKYPQFINYFTIYHLFLMIYLILTINFFSFVLLFRFFCFINHRNSFCHLLIILLQTLLLRIHLMILRRMTLLILVLEHHLYSNQVFFLFFRFYIFINFLRFLVLILLFFLLDLFHYNRCPLRFFFLKFFLFFFD